MTDHARNKGTEDGRSRSHLQTQDRRETRSLPRGWKSGQEGPQLRRPSAPFVISDGGGVQTSALIGIAISEGWPLQAVVFADTGEEQPHTIEQIAYHQQICREAGIPFAIVKGKDGTRMVDWYESTNAIPYVTARSCTSNFKILPVRRWLKENGFNPVNVALGITTDEAHRMRDSDVKWASNVFPLIDSGMSRQDCQEWLKANWKGPWPKKSGCRGCPMHGRKGYAALLREDPEEYDRWEQLEKNGRNYGTKDHHTLLPAGPTLEKLRQMVRTDTEGTTLSQFDDSDVAGLCAGGCFT